MRPTIDRIPHGAWPDCIRMRSEGTELRLLVDAGPRLIFLGPVGGRNLLYEAPPEAPSGPGGWRLLGGHRLWTAPEEVRLTYVPDHAPVEVAMLPDGVRLRGGVEEPTGIAKSLEVRMDGGAIHLRHILEQVEGHSLRAPWAITAFGPGGRAWLPRVRARAHPDALLPDQSLILWPYTDLSDPRLQLGRGGVWVDHDPARSAPIKIGAVHPPGWLAWSRGTEVVVQHTAPVTGPRADLGATHELYVDGALSELEALGAVQPLKPGEVSILDQTWWHRTLAEPVSPEALGALVHSLGLDPGTLGSFGGPS
jgi:hypothetical protein